MHKKLLLLGFLRERPLSGYQVSMMLSAHGDLYSDLKKGNVYYLLERMSREGLVSVKTEGGARGPRGERLIYSLTAAGKKALLGLLRQEIEDYQPLHGGIEVAAVLLSQLSKVEARSLLRKRLAAVDDSRRKLEATLGAAGREPGSAGDHMLLLAEAERRWLERALDRLEPTHRGDSTSTHGRNQIAGREC